MLIATAQRRRWSRRHRRHRALAQALGAQHRVISPSGRLMMAEHPNLLAELIGDHLSGP
ncbi:hypothetical protein [Nocardia seriolae]|uniref:hypothetical protein n=1 Tax=Nocardia seriolae TaxID=37332 RepID=UPI0004B760AB|nr:hypothetical protein [Nocardia seriolae]MTJ61401.1 hypothetical protein [Nocardia seriolae]MTJ76613.1 hypothetical protein [Nocardia seriolae]MTJ86434.1 hypothetical protein [Nocardia seriolae]MTK30428.1 hypothetical protein [Nocardia seriolae]MTK43628.1 hypothetical protein [Nocardia seriolae]